MSKTLILIPSRLAAKRLPRKPLLKIGGKSLIYHVYKKAKESKIGDVFVATGDKEIYNDIIHNGGKCILTKIPHKSGTDRIYEAFKKLKIKKVKYVLNIQGDEPLINKNDIVNLNKIAVKNKLDFCTLGSLIDKKKIHSNKNIVKVETINKLKKNNYLLAKNFFRKKKLNKYVNIYHHIGIYHYSVSALKKFQSFKQTKNEKKYKLEQLRAMDNKMSINVVLANSSPIGVDTLKEYKKVKLLMERNS